MEPVTKRDVIKAAADVESKRIRRELIGTRNILRLYGEDLVNHQAEYRVASDLECRAFEMYKTLFIQWDGVTK